MATNLATGIDAAYVDNATDPSVKQHQQDHDKLHVTVNAATDETAPDTYGVRALFQARIVAAIAAHLAASDPHGDRAYVDQQLVQFTPSANLAAVATSADALDVKGAELIFFYNTATGRYDYNATPNRSAEAFIASGHPKVFYGPSTAPPENTTSALGPSGVAIPVTPVFHKYDEHRIRL